MSRKRHIDPEPYFGGDDSFDLAPPPHEYSMALEHDGRSVLIKRGVCQRCKAEVPVSEAVDHVCAKGDAIIV